MDYTEKTLNSNEIYNGKILRLRNDTVMLPDGTAAKREVVEHSGGVAVLPLDSDGTVYCVRQYRYVFEEHIIEIPAGKLNDGEEPLECAVRELGEETGFTADEYIYLGEFFPSPGYCREKLYAYLALGLHKGKAHLDEGEFLDVEEYKFDELLNMCMRNELRDAKTIIAVLHTALKLKAKGENLCQEKS